jgi:hypothetical protein
MSDAITRKALLAGAGVGAVAVGAFLAGCGGGEEAPQKDAQLVARRVDGPLPVDDPRSSAWRGDGETLLALVAQQAAKPALAQVSVPDVWLSALHDGRTIAFRASWAQESAGEVDSLGVFHDAVAVMLPGTSRERPAITMGAPGAPVHIAQWRGSWQKDQDSGRRVSVPEIYPNYVRDLTPSELLPPRTAVLWAPGRAVGNPLSGLEERSPVEELLAEGFGSTTHLPRQQASGRGVFADGRWWVTIAMPMQRGQGLIDILGGLYWPVAVAVWSGPAGNRGGRKQNADWASMLVEA